MVSTSFVTIAAAVAVSVHQVQAHGFVENPKSEFKGSENSDWIVEIEPQWEGDWVGAKGDEAMVALYKELKAKNNVKDIRTLLDSDTKLYGQDCGFTNPDAPPKDAPTDGTATFSRGIVHAGPCEIWLDDKMVLQNDDCQSAYGDGTQETISIFKPVDYSSCAASGCMFRFYWIGLQRLDGKPLWQSYKNCIPLKGPPGGGASQTSPSTGDGSNVSQTSPSTGDSDSPSSGKSDGDSESPSTGDSDSPSSGESDSPDQQTTPAPESGDNGDSSPSSPSTPSTPSADTPEITPAPSSKCNGRRKRM
ncbi:thioredoxin reductase [Phytophthora boehmeriae]|uniref:Thioredoxin reductase n=1 Tax=Phytophthora boehmeriae TaxID=109152 RepID=A0A8T1WP83_9STRA|nr:thioredoxin reductase [Phytophthora boehmeriae]